MIKHRSAVRTLSIFSLLFLAFLNTPIHVVHGASKLGRPTMTLPSSATLLRYYPESPEAHFVGDGFEEVQTFAFRSDGKILAADSYLHGGPIRIYEDDVAFQISRSGRSYDPDMMDIDREGNVYVANWNWGAVTKYDKDGKKLLDIACWEADGEFNCFEYEWLDIAVDDLGFLWISDYSHGLLKFDSNGKYIAKITESYPAGLDADGEYIYVSRGNKVERRQIANYQLVGEYTYPGVQNFSSLEVTNDAKLYAAADNNSIVVFDLNSRMLAGRAVSRLENITQVKHLESDADGKVLAKATYQGIPSIYWLDSSGVTGEWRSRAGGEPEYFSSPRAIARDIAGNFYISDTENTRVEKYDSNFDYIGTVVDTSNWPYGKFGAMSVDADGSIYLRQTNGWDYRKYDSSGNLIYKKEDSAGHIHHELEFSDSEIVGDYWYSDGEVRYKDSGELVRYANCLNGSLARIGENIYAATVDSQQVRVCDLEGNQVRSIDLGYKVWSIEASGNRLFVVGADQKIYQYGTNLHLLEVASLPPVTDEKFVMYIDMVIMGRKIFLVDYMHSRVTLVRI